ncbi:MAG TPA: DNA topoisomerase 3 [Bryobacteraceae bacterium]|nr:DNA topoisomerase 3 [Bryobacteraceae bacterium]
MAGAETGTIAVLAEKPSVARDIARVLGAGSKGDGFLHGNGYVVTWAIGHLAALAQPHEIESAWRAWRRELLPMLPKRWPLVVYDKTKDQFEVVRKILNSPRVGRVVCATDAGREGELIFRYIYEAAGCAKPFERLWISSLTPEAIRKGFSALKPGADYDALADAARGRSRADWLVGMNLSRAYSLAYNEDLSVGRVQTPTLAMLVERELAIRSFVPEDYIEIQVTFHPLDAPKATTYQGTWFRDRGEGADKESPAKSMRLPADGEEAARIVARARTGAAEIESVESETQRMPPPLLYDLTELQRHANRLFGYSAQRTLEIAQALYETHKLLSYPRTDSRHLSQDVAATLPLIVQTIAGPYREHLSAGTGERPLSRRYVDDAKVTDHHAIIPTPTRAENAKLTAEERRIYDLVCRRLLSAWQDDHISSVTTVITAIRNGELTDRYHTSGTEVKHAGWKALDVTPERRQAEAEPQLPAGLKQGAVQEVVDAETLRKKTRPPKRFTEATLLTAMETAGKTLDEKELSDAMKENGLGTPATRAAIIEVLLKRGYVERAGKTLEATAKGIRLIEIVHPEVKSPAMTGQWEAYLGRIQKGKAQLPPFLKGIEDYVREVVGKTGEVKAETATSRAGLPSGAPRPAAAAALGQRRHFAQADTHAEAHAQTELGERVPLSGEESLLELLQRTFGYAAFRPNQEAVCRAAVAGQDVMLVMPTGSGKSLCYQLPGLARGGTTLVISPLIALMEDQAAKLKEWGCRVDRIHSGRERGASRQACIDYLNGELQFLFVAPERLRVAGFPEMLAKRKPSLIAIDEAHCISQWGHDFRPDYRMLGQYLPSLRPAPVIALTATATPQVQDDIVEQLGLTKPARFIHGFRRENIAIEAVEIATSQRAAAVIELLRDPARRPGIVYTPTRKEAENLAMELGALFPTAAYHAGLDAERRERAGAGFLAGKLEVITATIAFGMGIDKPDIRTVIHTALPGSLEAYYQEIGRAGRDGQPSRAVLMHSYADRYTHDFFFERDYPDVSILDAMFAKLRAEPMEMSALRRRVHVESDIFDKAVEKLWLYGGAVVDYADNISRGQGQWREAYIAQGEHKQAQLEEVIRYAQVNQCRMSALVRHFGDYEDARTDCGVCDFCAPSSCVAQTFRKATQPEREAAARALDALRKTRQNTTGRLYAELFPSSEMTRDRFEELLGAMARAGLVQLAEEVFEKDGRQIPFRKVRLGPAADSTDLGSAELAMRTAAYTPEAKRKRGKKKSKAAARGEAAKPKRARKPAPQKSEEEAAEDLPEMEAPRGVPPAVAALEDALRAWRLQEARRMGIPAFRIFSDQTLQAIARRRPATAAALLAIPGIGLNTVEKYGRHIYRILEEKRGG